MKLHLLRCSDEGQSPVTGSLLVLVSCLIRVVTRVAVRAWVASWADSFGGCHADGSAAAAFLSWVGSLSNL